MTRKRLDFVLVPDGGAARRVKRAVALSGARAGVVVGTWPELVWHARRAALLADAKDDWPARFHAALGALDGAFWSESHAVSPEETGSAVEAAFRQIVCASDPREPVDFGGLDALPERTRRHLRDLLRLAEALDGALPEGLRSIRDLLAVPAAGVIERIAVHRIDCLPALSRWQRALLDKLDDEAEHAHDDSLEETLRETLCGTAPHGAPGALAVLGSRLFALRGDKAALDDSVQWVGVRDFLEEAEVAAGMVQTLLAEPADLEPADIGLLLPASFEYALAVEDAFALAGLALSGLPNERWRRDLGREAVFHFLFCRRKPAPAMAMAVCISSPLMPWSRAQGADLAQALMDGDYRLKPPPSAGPAARAMLDLIRGADDDPWALAESLGAFADLLDGEDEPVEQARAAARELRALLCRSAAIDWPRVLRGATPKLLDTGGPTDFNLEGVTVWREGQEPWRAVRYLLVLGFSAGRYPAPPGSSPVFSTQDLDALRTGAGLDIDTPGEVLARRRSQLRRQLASVARHVTFFVPHLDPSGEVQAPSETLVFMAELFDAPGAPVLSLDVPAESARVRWLARAEPHAPAEPRSPGARDMDFHRDLLAVGAAAHGEPGPESPSSLETLMVSPLAWLLRRLRAEPLGWHPEAPDPTLLGTLAHAVLEGVFRPGEEPPQGDALERALGIELDAAIGRFAPFLRAAQWQVEKRNLETGLLRAAAAWTEVLGALGAHVLAGEAWLEGRFHGVAVHGQADLLLALPDERVLVVDYKRSSAGARRPRMEKGYDSQASLYRTMLRTGGPRERTSRDLITALERARETGIVYFMLNDRSVLSDAALPGSDAIAGWEVLDNAVSAHAMALIEKRLDEVRSGLVRLNREGDAEFFEHDAGIKPYALTLSPLIGLHTIADGGGTPP